MSIPSPDIDAHALAELRARLQEAEETLDAIRNGEVDAVVVGGPDGQQVYTLENADRPYRVLIEQMQEGAVTMSENGVILYCNERFATLVGAPRESLIGHHASPFFQDGSRSRFDGLLSLGRSVGAAEEFTLSAISGSPIPVTISVSELVVEPGMPRLLCAVVTDLSHSRQRSHELAAANANLANEIEERRRAEDRLQLALDAAGMANWDLDLATGGVRRSARHDEIFGFASVQPEWGVRLALDHFHPDDRPRLTHALRQAEQSGAIDLELRIRRVSDGSQRWIHIKGRTYFSGATPVSIAGIIADVTDRRAIEEQLRQSQKMEAVGQLTGGIAHDFNNLLAIISGSIEMLSRRVPPDDKTGFLFDAVRQGVSRGAKLNQQLLAFARRQDLRSEVVVANELIPTFENLIDRAVGETVAVQFERAADAWATKTDPHQLETAILNLAINARDAMPAGGAITIHTDNVLIAKSVADAMGIPAGEYIAIRVVDTGDGISPEDLPRVFEPFFTTKEVGKGTGLGLSQVYGFARQSRGFVTIDSVKGGGTTVSIHLPRTFEVAQTHEETSVPEAAVHAPGGIVLVVEDDADVRATTVGLFRDLGYEVREASSGSAALDVVSQETVDLVFSDVIMPAGMSGVELAKTLRGSHPNLPIVLTSGYTAQRLIPDDLSSELRLLRKPFSLADLSSAVADALGAQRVI